MLTKLTIKNIALIDYAEIDFTAGLNVLSGETGAGKSVILESINFVLGAKADKTLIRTGENECLVSAVFDVFNNKEIALIYSEFDFDVEDELIITRKFSIDGKSTIKINGNTATAGMLRKFTSILVDVHGQSEHFYLLKQSNQALLIDNYAGEDIKPVLENNKNIFSDYKNVISELETLGGEESSRAYRLDLLNYQINEIEKADIKDGEEEELKILNEKIKNKEKIYSSLSSIKSGLEDEGGVLDIVSNETRAISQISKLSEDYLSVENRLNAVYEELNDLSYLVSNMLEENSEEEFSSDYVEERLDLIKIIKKKYGDNFTEFYNNAVIERDKLLNFEVLAEKLLKTKLQLEDKLYENYLTLNSIRVNSSKTFALSVESELKTLGMVGAKFYANFKPIPAKQECLFNSYKGIDDIEFMFSANVGEPVKPLSLVISGGEMSRFMLAIKVVTSKLTDISTFIFDEIDAGISGNTASVVAEKFAKIAKNKQIIAISHLPQISAMADNNLLILKEINQDKSYTSVKKLSNQDKIQEIIRLVGGKDNSESAYLHAKELIAQAENFKNNI